MLQILKSTCSSCGQTYKVTHLDDNDLCPQCEQKEPRKSKKKGWKDSGGEAM
jgi:predicted RNA-binding Zn-ribbon protein involved in translation (DUF1610 family)